MRTTKLLQGTCLIGTSLFICGAALGADNCTGYDSAVGISVETLDLGNGHTLTAFRQASMLTSENSIYQLATGECSGAALSTPDGKVRVNGYCARRDKDGDTQSVEFSQAAGADKGTWKSTGGTGKFASKTDSGWFQDVRTDGKMTIAKWGGSCK